MWQTTAQHLELLHKIQAGQKSKLGGLYGLISHMAHQLRNATEGRRAVCPHRIERIGQRADGGKWMCGVDRVAKQDKCVIYSFGLNPCTWIRRIPLCLPRLSLTGVNDDSSYESTLLRRAPGC
ncbi:hypothetical protein BJV78DRAFT_149512 [Lactifluus subvellereus]|nr:hypothetical protein BJV78DRAFT_149512 [Lactifluus subvellereus]